MSTISEFLMADHRRCDAFLATATQAAARSAWDACRDRYDTFCAALKHHIAIEEEVLFPAFEEATGVSAGPTRVMRHEHQQIHALLASGAAALAARDAQRFDSLVQSLAALLTQHNLKEENVLYPMCDRALPDLAGEMLVDMVPQP